MSGAMREKDSADYDLERFIEMFDQALTSDDPRVKNALRQLMMIVILTDTDDHEGKVRNQGPLRRLFHDMRELSNRIIRQDEKITELQQRTSGLVTYGGGGYRVEGWPKDWQSGSDYTLGGPTWAVGRGVVTSGNIPPVSADDLNIKINPMGSGSLTGKK